LTFIGASCRDGLTAAIGGVNARVIRDNRCTLYRAPPFSPNDHTREMRGGCGTLQVLQSRETQQ
jgi:hypothetical protein